MKTDERPTIPVPPPPPISRAKRAANRLRALTAAVERGDLSADEATGLLDEFERTRRT